MAKNDQQEAYEKLLTSSLSRVNDWVKFAEAKNAALLAFSSACTVAIGNAFIKEGGPPSQFADFLPIAGCLFLSAALLAVLSFVPVTNLSSFFKNDEAISRSLNLVFFGDISAVPMEKISSRLRDRYMPPAGQSATDEYLDDLANQIHVNSAIASRKFRLFKISSWIVTAAIITLSIPAIRYVAICAIRLAIGASQ